MSHKKKERRDPTCPFGEKKKSPTGIRTPVFAVTVQRDNHYTMEEKIKTDGFIVYGFSNLDYLLHTPLPIYETVAMQRFHLRGFYSPSYIWQINHPEYRILGEEIIKRLFIVNHLYFASFNLTLLQFGQRETSQRKNTYLPIYWYRGPLKGYRIGSSVKNITFTILEPSTIAPLQQRYISEIN